MDSEALKKLVENHKTYNANRVDALLKRLAKLGIEADPYNLRSPYERQPVGDESDQEVETQYKQRTRIRRSRW